MSEYIVKQLNTRTFGLSGVSLAILALMDTFEVGELTKEEKVQIDFRIDIRNSAWYNGREKGVCITVSDFEKTLIITFGEGRNSDSIFVDTWEIKGGLLNPPTVADFTDEAYENRIYFKYNEIREATRHIETLVIARVDKILKDYRKQVKTKSK